ncbi:MAG: anhydro-N-acetylmuramic acid kinase [Planctomycetota bacterium]|jgi:anhydro-N-acetylmuramic acid kinase
MAKKGTIERLAKKKKLRVAGLMSGTSADGVDVVVVDIRDNNHAVNLIAFDTFPYPAALRTAVFKLFQPTTARLDDICHFNFVLGEVFANSITKLCKKAKISLNSIDLLGSHGQTIYHNPKGTRYGKNQVRSTLQIGEPSVITQRTGITTVADFRPRDMAAKGQGAPLVPFADYFLFRDKRICRAIQNIGGIANLTYLPRNCKPKDIIAFDTGPGNMIIDGLISMISMGKRKYDRRGKIASQGFVDKNLLEDMMTHPFFRRRPPKSTGREEFGLKYCEAFYKNALKKKMALKDIVTTATAFTAESIAQAYRKFLPRMPDEVILCGGGSHNITLVRMLQQKLGKTKIRLIDEFGIACDAKEAVSFAVLAYATIKGISNNVPSATGANQQLILGKIVPA